MHTPLRLLFVGTLAEPGGAASHFISLTTALAEAGHNIGVVAAPGSGIWRALQTNARVKLYGAAFTRTFEPSAMDVLRRAVRELRPNRIIGVFERDYWATALVAAQFRVPVELFLHHAGMKRTNRLLLRWIRRHFLVPSENLRKWIVARGNPSKCTSVLYNPIDTTHFNPTAEMRAAARRELGLCDEDVLVGYAGRLESNKGIIPFAHAVTNAMQRVPKLRALWIGFGRLEADLNSVITQSGFSDRHIRRAWTDDMLQYYAAMDMLALPSTGREAFGRVLVEAQSCAIPVLGSDIGGIPETMKADVTGRLIEPGCIASWTEAIVAWATDPQERLRVGSAGQEFVRSTFDSRVIVSTLENMLQPARA